MALEIKTKITPSAAGRQKFFSVCGPEDWEGVDWDKIALAVPPNYAIHHRIQQLFADLLNDWKALQRRKEAESREITEAEIRSKLAQKATWPLFDGLPSEVLADERIRDGIHLVYAKPRSGLEGGGNNKNGFLCPCTMGKRCIIEDK